MASITKRGSKWQYRVSWRDADGKQHSKNKSGFRTKTEAANDARQAELELSQGANLNRGELSLPDYWHDWYTTYKSGKRATATEYFYPIIEKTLKQYFGKETIKDVTPTEWQTFLNQYATNHSHATGTKVNGYVRAMVRSAINEQTLRSDFTFDAEVGGSKGIKESNKYLQLDKFKQVNQIAFERATFNYLSYVGIVIGAQSGMRASEVLGLTWDCIDYENHTLTVNKSWDYIHKKELKATKNEASNRVIEVLPSVTELLKKIHTQQIEWEMKSGHRNPLELVFMSNRGTVLTDAALNKTLSKIETEIDIPIEHQIRFHGLRHTHVSYLISQGLSIYYISKRLGHAGIQITMSTYSHLLDAQRSEQASKAVAALGMLQ